MSGTQEKKLAIFRELLYFLPSNDIQNDILVLSLFHSPLNDDSGLRGVRSRVALC